MRSGLLPAATVEVLGTFSFRVALPALVLRLIAGQPLSQTFEPAFYFGYLLTGGIVLAGAFTVSRWIAGQGAAEAGAHATTATVSNLGFLGPPLMLAYFGDRGAGLLAMAILAEVMVLMSIGSLGEPIPDETTILNFRHLAVRRRADAQVRSYFAIRSAWRL